MSAAERAAMGRPTYPQSHPAMAVARNIVNQILDEAGTDVKTRQQINDDCDQFAAWMIEEYAANSTDSTDDERRKSVLFNDITFAPLSGKGHLMFSDRLRLRDYLWGQGWRRDVRPEDVTER